jgi:hypothetical protein
MCVTAQPARINSTQTYVYATEMDGQPIHVCGYQNKATNTINNGGGNCMFLNFAGSDLQMVNGPEHTHRMMDDMTRDLPDLEYRLLSRGGSTRGFSYDISIQAYGDYTVILCQGPGEILSMLDQVPMIQRPPRSPALDQMIDFYMKAFPEDSFVLACFDGSVTPSHPITVSYKPRNENVLTIPGLDGHDGEVPTIGAPVYRDFSVAFAVLGVSLDHRPNYTDKIGDNWWLPSSLTGFKDNRFDGPNGDYVLPIDEIYSGREGRDLAGALLEALL